ncbi:four helix bundle protein [uncultured Flavobacterium sp.]|uniref:four helix bundle protein n=1 Tax=uncultured Flavobacterium sp. TaxID=165435 RepID=UPI0030EEA47A|tara:strand:+ start:18586 stop:18948 length:363 start_codon:yes stop_codon:yes gene_type:complete
MHNYKELEIWKASVKFCPKIYKITAIFPDSERFGLISQLTRAVISIPSNIAEGSAKSSDKHFLIFLENSLGSCYEIETQLFVSKDLGYIKESDYELLANELSSIIKMIINFMKYLQNKSK